MSIWWLAKRHFHHNAGLPQWVEIMYQGAFFFHSKMTSKKYLVKGQNKNKWTGGAINLPFMLCKSQDCENFHYKKWKLRLWASSCLHSAKMVQSNWKFEFLVVSLKFLCISSGSKSLMFFQNWFQPILNFPLCVEY